MRLEGHLSNYEPVRRPTQLLFVIPAHVADQQEGALHAEGVRFQQARRGGFGLGASPGHGLGGREIVRAFLIRGRLAQDRVLLPEAIALGRDRIGDDGDVHVPVDGVLGEAERVLATRLEAELGAPPEGQI